MEITGKDKHRLVFRTPAFIATFLAFGLFGFITGIWEVLLADLRTSISLSTGAFGLALTVGILAAVPAMILGGRIVDQFNPRVLIGITGLTMGLAIFGISQVDSYLLLVGTFLLYFAANSAYDVGINAAGINIEQTKAQQILTYFHAAFSGFAAVGALLTGILLTVGENFRLLYIGLSIGVTIVSALLFLSRSLPDRQQNRKQIKENVDHRSLFRNFAVVLIAVIVFLSYFAEGTIENWSAVYLRTWLTLPIIVGASGVALFHLAMATGRLGGAQLISVFDRRWILRAAGVLGTVGMVLSVITTIPFLILVGLFVVGLSMSVVSPIGYSLAGDFAPRRSGEASSVVSVVGWSAFIISPALVGGLAEVVGLRAALAIVILTASLIAVLTYRIPDHDSQTEKQSPSELNQCTLSSKD